MKNLIICILALLFSSSVYSSGKQWVFGNIEYVRDFGGHGGNAYQVAVKLRNHQWQHSGNGASVCANSRFLVVVGKNGITETSQQRMVSMLLAAYMANKTVGLYVATVAEPECTVEIFHLGENI